jgi:hypothetical protein
MDLASYAELAVRLVNTDSLGHEGRDQIATLDGLRALVADRQHLNHGVTRRDLEELRGMREELRGRERRDGGRPAQLADDPARGAPAAVRP